MKKDAVEVINEIAEGEPLAKMAQAISMEAASKPKISAPAKAVSKVLVTNYLKDEASQRLLMHTSASPPTHTWLLADDLLI